VARARDPRLDVFRGAGMLIILIAHIPGNGLAEWIPARFGFSDATEIFVLCSGFASALAFGRVFDEAGWTLGTARIVHRLWHVYWVHVGVFLATVAALAAADMRLGGRYLQDGLALAPLLTDPAGRLLAFLTLRWVPNYFDILPMYLMVLAMLPLVVAVQRTLGRAAVLALSFALWGGAAIGLLDLSADPATGRPWFFNPFSWQFLFLIGFALGRGWLAPPPLDRRLLAAAALVLIAAAPVSCHLGWTCHAGFGRVPLLGDIHHALLPLADKTTLGPLRILHVLALAYLAAWAAGPSGVRLRGPAAEALALVGRQTLPVFLSGLVLAQLIGIGLDVGGRTVATVALANAGGCLALLVVAATAAWFKDSPWSPRKARLPVAAAPA
jgi:hypothetical protein